METFMTQQISSNLESQLLKYGDNIVNNNFSRNDLVRTSQLLANEGIIIQVYLEDGRTIYPVYDQRFDANLPEEDLRTIKTGQYLGFRSMKRINYEGQLEDYLIVYLPHHDVGQFPGGFISLAAPLTGLQDQIEEIRKNIFISFLVTGIIGVLLSFLSAVYQTRKIKKLQALTKEISSGNYDLSVDVTGNDEFADLAKDFQRMADSLLKSEEEIKRQEELRRQFMMDVAHEMRTPLTTMTGMVEGLKYGMIPDKQKGRSLDLIYKETQRLTRLVNEHLDYEKIRSRQFILKKVKINGQKLFQEIQTQMNIKAEDKGNRIVLDMDEGLEFYADYDRLVQIIMNLLSNAIQFSENSDILLQGRMKDTYAEIRVIDQGIGIAEKDLKAIFERFYKVDESRKNTKYGESGIGLSVVHSLVEAHQGQILVESQLNQGSTFIVQLPYKGE